MLRTDTAGLIIAGFHRSGTSALTGLLAGAGVPLGHDLFPPHFSNPDGHFEDRAFVEINDAVLAAAGGSWRWDGAVRLRPDEAAAAAMRVYCAGRGDSARWAVKDPRAGLLAEAWFEASGRRLTVLAPVRDVGACVDSLCRRHAEILAFGSSAWRAQDLALWIDGDLPFRMWCAHHEALLRARQSGGVPVRFFDHRSVLAGDESLIRWMGLESLSAGRIRAEYVTATSTEAGFGDETRLRTDRIMRRLRKLDGVELRAPASAGAGYPDSDALCEEVRSLVDRLPFAPELVAPSTPAAPPVSKELAALRALMDKGAVLEAYRGLSGWTPGAAERSAASQLRVRVEQSLGRWESAAALYQAQLSGAPRFPAPLPGLAECWRVLGRLDDAEAVVNECCLLELPYPWVWMTAASTVRRLARPELSRRFEAAMVRALPAGQEATAAVLAEWELRRATPDLDKAASLLANATRAAVPTPGFNRILIELRLRQGDRAGAWTQAVRHCLATHTRESYRQHLDHCLDSVSDPAMRLDLAARWLGVLRRFEGAAATGDG